MCRSVPHMDAILTLTSTSVGPNCGLGTSRISVPGAGSGFTTASIVSGMRAAPPPQNAAVRQPSMDKRAVGKRTSLARPEALSARLLARSANIGIAMSVVEDARKVMQDLIAPELRALSARLDAVEKRLDAIDKRFDGVDKRFDSVDRKFEDVERRRRTAPPGPVTPHGHADGRPWLPASQIEGGQGNVDRVTALEEEQDETAVAVRSPLTLSLALLLRHPCIVLLALVPGNAQGLPLRALPVLRQKDDLPDVIRVVRNLAVDGLEHGMRLAANGDGALQVLGMKRIDGLKDHLPILFPRAEHFFALSLGVHDKFAVAMAVGLLAVAGQKISEAGAHVAR